MNRVHICIYQRFLSGPFYRNPSATNFSTNTIYKFVDIMNGTTNCSHSHVRSTNKLKTNALMDRQLMYDEHYINTMVTNSSSP